MEQVYLSVVIPIYNEVDNVEPLTKQIIEALAPINKPFEIIYVDDYSNDGTRKKLDEVYEKYPCVKVVKFRRNFGQTAAMTAGFDYAKGEVIVSMDGDMQNDPSDIPAMLDKFNEGYDIVSGWRKNRKDNIIRTFPSKIANILIRNLTGVRINDYGCSLKVYSAEIAKELELYGEMHRFIPAIAAISGAEITDMPVKHHPRIHGVSKYSLKRTFKVFLDLLTVVFMRKFFTRPLHVFGRVALFIFAVISIWATLSFTDAMFHYIPFDLMDTDDALILFFVMLFYAVQLLCTGIIAEMQVRTYFESQKKKTYTVREVLSRDSECLEKV